MSIIGPIGIQRFLKEYWQKVPLLVRNATSRFESILSAEELAGLALEENIESRIVIENLDDQSWHAEDGPFDEKRFETLPKNNWTLLVQSVDQWVPEVADVLAKFAFLPRWRLDDVMVSYATPGGGVGPHFDYYDVFLLQVFGQRRWRLGQKNCDEYSALKVDQPLKLLSKFEQSAEHLLRPGDMLYVPAGLAHWGTAESDDCMTWSIGFRAPSAPELLVSGAERVAAKMSESLRYRDRGSLRGGSEITDSVDKGLDRLFEGFDKSQLMEAVKSAFVAQVTEPRYLDAIEVIDDVELASIIEDVKEGCALIERSPHSRFAYRRIVQDGAQNSGGAPVELHVDGISYDTELDIARMICDGEIELLRKAAPLIQKLLKTGALVAL